MRNVLRLPTFVLVSGIGVPSNVIFERVFVCQLYVAVNDLFLVVELMI